MLSPTLHPQTRTTESHLCYSFQWEHNRGLESSHLAFGHLWPGSDTHHCKETSLHGSLTFFHFLRVKHQLFLALWDVCRLEQREGMKSAHYKRLGFPARVQSLVCAGNISLSPCITPGECSFRAMEQKWPSGHCYCSNQLSFTSDLESHVFQHSPWNCSRSIWHLARKGNLRLLAVLDSCFYL